MESDEETSILVKALPPATDYVTYLMLLEYNLRKEDLPQLHELLQDEKLTINIGWDLVQILLPLLPEAEQCLHDVAALGNPREVVLKIDEQLEQLARRLAHDDDDDEDEQSSEDVALEATAADADTPDSAAGDFPSTSKESSISLLQMLIQMLCVLHPRIKTKRPSSFLETSIVPVRQAYSALASSPSATRMVLMFIKAMSGSKRPAPPPRNQELQIPSVIEHTAAADPEAQDGGEEPEEAQRQRELLQALLTHVTALHLDRLSSDDTCSALAWTDRVNIKREPDRIPSFRKSHTKTFQQSDEFRSGDVLVNQVLMIATGDLKLDPPTVLQLLVDGDSPELEISVSRTGLLYILAALISNSVLRSRPLGLQIGVFPEHDRITTAILGEPESISTDVSPLTADALIVTGWYALDGKGLESDPAIKCDDQFNRCLQKLSALAALHPTPMLREQAYSLLTALLHAHKSSSARLAFIVDTIQFCPFSNLREAAVGWVKRELLSANDDENVFTRSETLDILAQHLFEWDASQTSAEAIMPAIGYHLAALNLLFLLCSSRDLSKRPAVRSFVEPSGVAGSYLDRLERAVRAVQDETKGAQDSNELALVDLDMLLATIQQCRDEMVLVRKR